jgi:hypothetical protein
MMLDVGRDMFVMRLSRSQTRIFWMRGGIVPPHSLSHLVQLVAVTTNLTGIQIEQLPYVEDIAIIEDQLALHFCSKRANGVNGERGRSDARELIRQAGDLGTILFKRRKHIRPPQGW